MRTKTKVSSQAKILKETFKVIIKRGPIKTREICIHLRDNNLDLWPHNQIYFSGVIKRLNDLLRPFKKIQLADYQSLRLRCTTEGWDLESRVLRSEKIRHQHKRLRHIQGETTAVVEDITEEETFENIADSLRKYVNSGLQDIDIFEEE